MRIIGNNPAADNAEITAVASGTLANGDAVIVNADGTVSVVSETSVSEALGTPSLFRTGTITYSSVAFDSSANKIVIAYKDNTNSSYGTAVVATVSGTSISFGTPVVFAAVPSDHIAIGFDSNVSKILIAYQDPNNNRSRAIAGTVSGTSISFGNPSNFGNDCIETSIAYDSSSGRSVIAYRNSSSSNYGTAVTAAINASTSGVSFGTAVVFDSAVVRYTSTAFDSVNNKIVISYQNTNSYTAAVVGTVTGSTISFGTSVFDTSATGKRSSCVFDTVAKKIVIMYDGISPANMSAIVGTVSGTSISFGAAIVADSVRNTNTFISGTFDSNAGKVVFVYSDLSNASHGTLISGTVSGTSITFDTPVVFDGTGSERSSWLAATFDSNSSKVVVAYLQVDGQHAGNAVTFSSSYTSTTLTAENYIGMANGAAVDGGTARVQIGSGINGAQSGLTAGQQYFVQLDGTLGLTAADPSVIAGTAISATEIIVKG